MYTTTDKQIMKTEMTLTIAGEGWRTATLIELRNIEQIDELTFKADTSYWGSSVVFKILETVEYGVIVHATMDDHIRPRIGERSILRCK